MFLFEMTHLLRIEQGIHLAVCQVIVVELRVELFGKRRKIYIAELVWIKNLRAVHGIPMMLVQTPGGRSSQVNGDCGTR
jgi:hypothetical protein